MIGSMWSKFVYNGDNLGLNRLIGPSHFRQMVRNYGKSTPTNKDMRFKRERKLKYNLSVFFMIFLIMNMYGTPRNN